MLKLSQIFNKSKRLERKKYRDDNKEFREGIKKRKKEQKLLSRYEKKYGRYYECAGEVRTRNTLKDYEHNKTRMSEEAKKKYGIRKWYDT
jgi:hypothetical protein